MRKNIQKVGSLILAVAIICGFCVIAYAAQYHSATKTATVYNHQYTYWSTIHTPTEKFVTYSVSVTSKNGGPAGYYGLKPRLYSDDGSLVAACDWEYSDTDEAGTYTLTYPGYYFDIASGDYYYSRGQVKFYDGNGYTTYTSNASPNLHIPITAKSVKVNILGETYGSELFLSEIGVHADLIQAVGNNGIIGYVKDSDLNADDNVNNPNEAVNYMSKNKTNRIIPLYKNDGTTVIDTFTVFSGQNISQTKSK